MASSLAWTLPFPCIPGAAADMASADDLPTLSEAALVEACLAGRAGAFDLIVERHRRSVYQLCYRFVGNHEDASDLAQDAFIRAYRALRATDRPMALRPWLYMIVRNRALDELRAPARTAAYDDELYLRAAPDADAARCVEERAEVRALVDEIARLPERQRLALVMREFGGSSHVETPRALRTTVPATKSLLIRARSSLHTTLHDAA